MLDYNAKYKHMLHCGLQEVVIDLSYAYFSNATWKCYKTVQLHVYHGRYHSKMSANYIRY